MCAQVAASLVHSEVKARSGELVVCRDIGDFRYEWTTRQISEGDIEVDVVAQVVQNLSDEGIKFFASSAYSREDLVADPLTAVLTDACNVIEFREKVTPFGNGNFYSDSPLIAKKMEHSERNIDMIRDLHYERIRDVVRLTSLLAIFGPIAGIHVREVEMSSCFC